jgi:hypothetical protein
MATDPARNPRTVLPLRGGASREPTGDLPAPLGSGRRSRSAVACWIVLTIIVCVVAVGRGFGSRRDGPQYTGQTKPLGTVPGEFERQDAMLLAWPQEPDRRGPAAVKALCAHEDQLLCEMVRTLRSSVHVVVLVPNPRSEGRVRQLLSRAGVPLGNVSFTHVPFSSIRNDSSTTTRPEGTTLRTSRASSPASTAPRRSCSWRSCKTR